jgi:hypothetical protein
LKQVIELIGAAVIDAILTYREMCDTENVQTLQRGMNYRLSARYSVILMSQRNNAPYNDEIQPDGLTIHYEGHDVLKTSDCPFPKMVDQPSSTKTGRLTQNGKFVAAIEKYRTGQTAELIKVYEKLFTGVWSLKGMFNLVDYRIVHDGQRNTFRFVLQLVEDTTDSGSTNLRERSRIIPTLVKKAVWERDGGQCVICGATDELHFDHDIPYSKGGASITVDNVKILCARHNLSKSDKIE